MKVYESITKRERDRKIIIAISALSIVDADRRVINYDQLDISRSIFRLKKSALLRVHQAVLMSLPYTKKICI